MGVDKQTLTWREQRLKLKPLTSDVVYFSDTYPNHILVNNPSSSPIYMGVNGNVNPASYDMVVSPYGTKMLARPIGTNRVHLYVESDDPVEIQVTSWEGTFDPSSIAQSQEMVGTGSDGLLGIVEVNNILSPLPSGTNVIGGVVISEHEVSLPPGNNLIGQVRVSNMATSQKVVATEPGEVVVSSNPGLVYSVASDGTVQLLDGNREAWKPGDFQFPTPLYCEESIKIKFENPGEAYILFLGVD